MLWITRDKKSISRASARYSNLIRQIILIGAHYHPFPYCVSCCGWGCESVNNVLDPSELPNTLPHSRPLIFIHSCIIILF